MLETVEIEPRGDAAGTVVWLHGLGADGHDFEAIVPELALDGVLPLRFVFPHAPVRPVTLNGGMPMRAWFDLYDLGERARVDDEGLRAARADIVELIERENARGIACGSIVLAGFSQGGTLALVTGLAHPEPLAGIIGLSCWLPPAFAAVAPAQQATPVFLAHGSEDPMVAVRFGRATRTALVAAGSPVSWNEYMMGHQVCAGEIADLRKFLLEVFKVTGGQVRPE